MKIVYRLNVASLILIETQKKKTWEVKKSTENPKWKVCHEK